MTELTCRDFVEEVTAFLEDALDEGGTQRFLTHLAGCPGCDRYLAQFQLTTRSLTDLPAEPLPPASRSALLEAFRRAHPDS